MISLTLRQEKLKEKLDIFCNRIQREQLPLIVDEVWGFGSFFRLKDSPKDVDLILKHSGKNPIYKKFEQIFQKSISKNSEYDLPKDAFLAVARSELTKKEFEKYSSLFTSWVENYTWNVIFGGMLSIPELVVNEINITKRVLLKELKGIQIFQIIPKDESLDSLRAERVHLVWSDLKPNASANLEKSLSPENVRLSRITELGNFDKQISSHKIECDVILSLLDHVKKLKRLTVDFYNFKETLQKNAHTLFPNISNEILSTVIRNVRMAHPDEQIVPHATDLPSYDNFTDDEIKEEVEIKRDELKYIQKKLIVARALLYFFYSNTYEEKNEWQKRFTTEQLVVIDVLTSIPKKVVSEDKMRKILKELGFPEEQVLREKGRGGRYTVPKNKEEEEKIIRHNKEAETRSKYHRILQPTIKQFNKNIWFDIILNEDYKPINVMLYYHYSNYSESEIPESVSKTIQFLRGSGFVMTLQKYVISGTRTISIIDCQTNKEIKAKVTDSLR